MIATAATVGLGHAASELLLQAAALVGALGVLVGAAWYLLGPRVRLFLSQVQTGAQLSAQQLDPERDGDNAASYAKHAAEAADAVPALQEQVAANVLRLTALTLTVGQLQAHDLPTRVKELETHQELLDAAQRIADQRLAAVEQAVIADLGRQHSRPRDER